MNKLLSKLFYSDLLKDIRAQHYHAAYNQGRFDENLELTYKLGKYNDRPNCPDCSRKLPEDISLCHTGACKYGNY